MINKIKIKTEASKSVATPGQPGPSTRATATEKQLTLSEAFEKILFWDLNDVKAKKYHYLIEQK